MMILEFKKLLKREEDFDIGFKPDLYQIMVKGFPQVIRVDFLVCPSTVPFPNPSSVLFCMTNLYK